METGRPSSPVTPRPRPRGPGVYRMIDAGGEVLYVGKAPAPEEARAELCAGGKPQQPHRPHDRQHREHGIRHHARREIEALLLEANLIKRLKPRYNVVLRDDKSFPFILIARDHEFPQILKHRGARSRKGDYFGPFASAGAVGRTINTLQRAFLLRSCSDAYFESRAASLPALSDQALQRALHRRDLGSRTTPRWSTRR